VGTKLATEDTPAEPIMSAVLDFLDDLAFPDDLGEDEHDPDDLLLMRIRKEKPKSQRALAQEGVEGQGKSTINKRIQTLIAGGLLAKDGLTITKAGHARLKSLDAGYGEEDDE
jgi:hypothetical protein